MSEDKELEWKVQKKLNIWNMKQKHSSTLEELFDGNIRYLKFIKERTDEETLKDAFELTANFAFDKNMSGIMKAMATLLKTISKRILLKRIVNQFWVSMQYIVDLDCIKKIEYNPEFTEIIVQKCTGKRAWKKGLKNNKAKDLFSLEDHCEHSCVKLLNKLLELVNAKCEVEFTKTGCRQIIKFIEKEND